MRQPRSSIFLTDLRPLRIEAVHLITKWRKKLDLNLSRRTASIFVFVLFSLLGFSLFAIAGLGSVSAQTPPLNPAETGPSSFASVTINGEFIHTYISQSPDVEAAAKRMGVDISGPWEIYATIGFYNSPVADIDRNSQLEKPFVLPDVPADYYGQVIEFHIGSPEGGKVLSVAGPQYSANTDFPKEIKFSDKDNDSDELNNFKEYLLGTKIDSADTDNDKETDGKEVLELYTNPLNKDQPIVFSGDIFVDGMSIDTFIEKLETEVVRQSLDIETAIHYIHVSISDDKYDDSERVRIGKGSDYTNLKVFNHDYAGESLGGQFVFHLGSLDVSLPQVGTIGISSEVRRDLLFETGDDGLAAYIQFLGGPSPSETTTAQPTPAPTLPPTPIATSSGLSSTSDDQGVSELDDLNDRLLSIELGINLMRSELDGTDPLTGLGTQSVDNKVLGIGKLSSLGIVLGFWAAAAVLAVLWIKGGPSPWRVFAAFMRLILPANHLAIDGIRREVQTIALNNERPGNGNAPTNSEPKIKEYMTQIEGLQKQLKQQESDAKDAEVKAAADNTKLNSLVASLNAAKVNAEESLKTHENHQSMIPDASLGLAKIQSRTLALGGKLRNTVAEIAAGDGELQPNPEQYWSLKDRLDLLTVIAEQLADDDTALTINSNKISGLIRQLRAAPVQRGMEVMQELSDNAGLESSIALVRILEDMATNAPTGRISPQLESNLKQYEEHIAGLNIQTRHLPRALVDICRKLAATAAADEVETVEAVITRLIESARSRF